MSETQWPTLAIEDVMAELYDGPHATPPPSEHGPVYLGIKNITDAGRLDLSQVRHISESDFPRWTKRVEPQPGDIVFTYEATLHRYAIIPDGFRGSLGRRIALIRPDDSKVDRRYLYYYFLSPQWRRTVEQRINIGSTVDRIPLTEFPSYPIPVPPLGHQRAVAAALEAMDGLIENNRRRIEILEEMARLIYREWFVHFRFSSHEDVELVDSDLGLIPEGWHITSLADHVELKRRNVKPGESPGEEFDHYSIPAFDADRLPAVETGSEIKSGKYQLDADCVLLSKLNPRFARVWRVSPGQSERRSVCSTEFLVLEAIGDWSSPFAFSLVSDTDFGARLASMAGGTSTSHQRAKPKDVMALPVTGPPEELIAAFSDQVGPMLDLADNLIRQNDVLSKSRDLLLPRLISGELDVSDLDIDLELEPVA